MDGLTKLIKVLGAAEILVISVTCLLLVVIGCAHLVVTAVRWLAESR